MLHREQLLQLFFLLCRGICGTVSSCCSASPSPAAGTCSAASSCCSSSSWWCCSTSRLCTTSSTATPPRWGPTRRVHACWCVRTDAAGPQSEDACPWLDACLGDARGYAASPLAGSACPAFARLSGCLVTGKRAPCRSAWHARCRPGPARSRCRLPARALLRPAPPQVSQARFVNAGYAWITVDGVLLQVGADLPVCLGSKYVKLQRNCSRACDAGLPAVPVWVQGYMPCIRRKARELSFLFLLWVALRSARQGRRGRGVCAPLPLHRPPHQR